MSRRLLSAALVASLVLAACESDGSGPDGSVEGTAQIDATSQTAYKYFSFATGGEVTIADPQTSANWDLAFQRFELHLNGGVAGGGDVVGYNLANNANATTPEFLAMTAATQKAAFDAVGEADIPADGSFIVEHLEANPYAWLDFGAGAPAPADDKAWKLRRTTNGGYAVFRATAITFTGPDLGTATIEWRYQPAGGVLGTAQSATIDLGTANVALNFATGALTAATGCEWDVTADADYNLIVNDACNVGTFPLSSVEDFAALTTASTAPEYGAFLAGVSGVVPASASLDDKHGAFLYGLAGDHRITPTFNIFLVKVGTAVYKVQFIDYYSATGVSGHPKFRWARIR